MLVKHNGRVVGEIAGRTYITRRNPDIHFARKFGGYGIQLDIYTNDIRPNVDTILIELTDGSILWSSLQDWEHHGRVGCLNPRDGEQIFLELSYFRSAAQTSPSV